MYIQICALIMVTYPDLRPDYSEILGKTLPTSPDFSVMSRYMHI